MVAMIWGPYSILSEPLTRCFDLLRAADEGQGGGHGGERAPVCTVLTHHLVIVRPLRSISAVWHKGRARPGLPATQSWAQAAEQAESRPKRRGTGSRAGLQVPPPRAPSAVCPGTTEGKSPQYSLLTWGEKSNRSVSHKPNFDQL